MTRIEEKISRKAMLIEKSLVDETKLPTFERKYLDICSVCNQFNIKHDLMDIAFNSFVQGRGSVFSKKYLRRFARRVVDGKDT